MNLVKENLSVPNEHGVYVDNLDRTQKRGRSNQALDEILDWLKDIDPRRPCQLSLLEVE